MQHTPQSRMEAIVQTLKAPSFPNYQVNILDYGAISGTEHCQTHTIQQAIDTVSSNGGGTVLVPSGSFLTGALRLSSGVRLHLDQPDSVLRFTTEMTEEHYPLVFSHWEASPCYNYSALLYALDAENIAVTGNGVLDGQASYDTWWGWHHQVENAWSQDKTDLQNPARMALRQMNAEGVPVENRRFGNGHYLRPNFIQFIRCNNILLEGVTLKNSPMWQLNPVLCNNVIVRGMTLSAHGCNSDGCDPESCTNVLIEQNCFETGDDCISLKSGRDRDGRLAAIPCQNVVIRDNLFVDGHGGIALGSELSGGIQDVYADNNRFESPNLTYILRFKANAKRGGFIKKIWLHNTVATAVNGAAIHATMLYEDGRNGDYLPCFEDIHIENLTASGGDYGIFLEAFPEVPINGLVLKNITIDGVGLPIRALNWEAPVLENLHINGIGYPRPTEVRILGIPSPGAQLHASALLLGGNPQDISYQWLLENHRSVTIIGEENSLLVPPDTVGKKLCLLAKYGDDLHATKSISYTILKDTGLGDVPPGHPEGTAARRLAAKNVLPPNFGYNPDQNITRMELAKLLLSFCPRHTAAALLPDMPSDSEDSHCARIVISNGLMALIDGKFLPAALISRQEMATVAMQGCGVSYKNASTTVPVCRDATQIAANYSTNVARSIYLGFMDCNEHGDFQPLRPVTWSQAVIILDHVACFARL